MKYTTATILASLLATSSAQTICPNGAQVLYYRGGQYCCPGYQDYTNPNSAYCIIGCTVTGGSGGKQCGVFDDYCSSSPSQPATTSGVCTPVPVTATDYSQQVYGTATGSVVPGTTVPGTVIIGGAGSSGGVAGTAGATISGAPGVSIGGGTAGVSTASSGSGANGSAGGTATGSAAVATGTSGSMATSASTSASTATSSTSTSLSKAGGAAITAAPVMVLGAVAGIMML